MDNKEKNFVSAVVYVHNAEDRIKSFLDNIIDVFQKNFEHSEIICVNDASDDDVVKVIKEVGIYAGTTSISIVNMSYFHGVEAAMNAGVDLAIGDFVFEFDNTNCDYHSSLIMDVYWRSLKGFDIVSASPNRKERVSSKIFYKVFSYFSNLKYGIRTESFRVLSRRVINRIASMNKAVFYRKAIYATSGLKSDNILYDIGKDKKEKYNDKEKGYRLDLAIDSLLLFTEVGYQFSIMMTVMMMLISIFMTVYSIVIYFASNPVAGWTTTILFLSVVFFGLFGILTIIVKYLQLLMKLIFKRKHYSFESIEKVTK